MNCEHAVKSYLHSIQEIISRLPTEERGVLERSLVSIWGWCSLFRGVSRCLPRYIENLKHIFPEMKLRGLVSTFYIFCTWDRYYLESLFSCFVWENSQLSHSSGEKGRELPPSRSWQQFPALPSAPAVEPRAHINNQHTNFDSTAGAERMAGNCRQAVVGSSSLHSPLDSCWWAKNSHKWPTYKFPIWKITDHKFLIFCIRHSYYILTGPSLQCI